MEPLKIEVQIKNAETVTNKKCIIGMEIELENINVFKYKNKLRYSKDKMR